MKTTRTLLMTSLLLGLVSGCASSPRTTSRAAFYPIGIFGVPNTNDFPILRSAGFNTVVGPAEKTYLDAAQQWGLKVLASPVAVAGAGPGPAPSRKVICSLDAHPALLAWYIMDEPDLNLIAPEEVTRLNRAWKELGVRKPTALTLFKGYEARHYGHIPDILMIDRYPVPWLPLANFGQHVGLARLARGQEKPLMAIIQAFDWSYFRELLPGANNFRPPTPEELRCMTYEALARGANGIFYYTFESKWNIRDHPETWNGLQAVVKEVNERLPLFQAEPAWWPKLHEFSTLEAGFNEALESAVTSISVLVRAGNDRVPAGRYIVAVNNTARHLTYRFTLPPREVRLIPTTGGTATPAGMTAGAASSEVPVLGENRALQAACNWVEDVFAGYAVHVYGPLP